MVNDVNKFIMPNGDEIKIDSGSGLEVCDIGIALYVDETKGLRRYLNGQVVDINANTQAFLARLKEITTLHPSLLTTEENWQAAKTMSAFGQVGKFVFNYADDGVTVVSVRIPRVVNLQGVFDLQNLGMTVSAGLPTHKHTRGTMNITGGNYRTAFGSNKVQSPTGAFGWTNGGGNGNCQGGYNTALLNFDASRSWTGSTSVPDNSIYGNSNTVQPEAIQYPYFIQIATGSETENNIINDIELNNPYSLFDSKYSPNELNNLSWLKSEGQWNAKAVYTDAYDKLLKAYNGTETVEGLSVKLSTESYTNYDFVINTSDETFRLPLLDGSEDLSSDKVVELSIGESDSAYTAPANGWYYLRRVATASGQHATLTAKVASKGVATTSGQYLQVYVPVTRGQTVKVSYTAPTAGTFRFIYAQGNGSLYFYVGETVQNANLIDAGRIGEQLATKTDMLQASSAGMPSGKYIDLTLGASGSNYTAPANGYFNIRKISSGAGQILWLQNASAGNLAGPLTKSTTNNEYLSAFVPAKKGQKAAIEYTLGGATQFFRFIYAEGSK